MSMREKPNIIVLPPNTYGFTEMNIADQWKRISEGRIKARHISLYCVISHQNGVYPLIGEGAWIGHFTIIDGSQGLTIGRNVEVSNGVHIYTHSTHERATLGKKKLVGSVEIGDNVFLGAKATVSHGCKIGSNVILAAHAFLKPYIIIKDSEVWGGIPAKKIIGRRKGK